MAWDQHLLVMLLQLLMQSVNAQAQQTRAIVTRTANGRGVLVPPGGWNSSSAIAFSQVEQHLLQRQQIGTGIPFSTSTSALESFSTSSIQEDTSTGTVEPTTGQDDQAFYITVTDVQDLTSFVTLYSTLTETRTVSASDSSRSSSITSSGAQESTSTSPTASSSILPPGDNAVNNPSLSSRTHHTDVAAMVGGIIGGVVASLSLIGALYYYRRWNRRRAMLYLHPIDEESKTGDKRKKKKKKKKKKRGITSIIFVTGACHTAFHMAPVIAAMKQCGAEMELPDEDGDESSRCISSDYAHSVATAWKAALDDPRLNLPNPRRSTAHSLRAVSASGTPHIDGRKYILLPRPLYSAGLREPPGTFSLDVQHVLEVIVQEAVECGNEVCLVAHGAAGVVALEAMNCFYASSAKRSQKAKLKHFIAVSAVLSSRGVVETQAGVPSGWMNVDLDHGHVKMLNAIEFLYNDMSPDSARPFLEALVTQVMPEATRGGKSSVQLLSGEGWRKVPRKTYMVCENDQILGTEYQVGEAEFHGMRLSWFDAGHCGFVSKPQEFVEKIAGIVSSS